MTVVEDRMRSNKWSELKCDEIELFDQKSQLNSYAKYKAGKSIH